MPANQFIKLKYNTIQTKCMYKVNSFQILSMRLSSALLAWNTYPLSDSRITGICHIAAPAPFVFACQVA